ncbi:sulfite exporter TauE/SafE family protein, partial [Gordonia rhizosphera]
LDQPLSTAITQSLIIVGISSATGVLAHAREGRVRWRAGIALGVVGGVAAWAGTAIGRHVPSDATLTAFAVLMVVVATTLLVRTRSRTRPQPEKVPSLVPAGGDPVVTPDEDVEPVDDDIRMVHPAKAALRIVVAGLGIGLLTGFFGVGGGFVIVPALILFLGYSMPVAVGTSLLVITINSAVALGSRIGDAPLDWSIIAPVAIAAIAGSFLGKRVAQRFSDTAMTRAFGVMLIVVAAYVAARSIGVLPN